MPSPVSPASDTAALLSASLLALFVSELSHPFLLLSLSCMCFLSHSHTDTQRHAYAHTGAHCLIFSYLNSLGLCPRVSSPLSCTLCEFTFSCLSPSLFHVIPAPSHSVSSVIQLLLPPLLPRCHAPFLSFLSTLAHFLLSLSCISSLSPQLPGTVAAAPTPCCPCPVRHFPPVFGTWVTQLGGSGGVCQRGLRVTAFPPRGDGAVTCCFLTSAISTKHRAWVCRQTLRSRSCSHCSSSR